MECLILLFLVAMASTADSILDHEYSRTPLGDNIDKASVKLLKEAYLASENTNVVTSPLGVLLLLSLYSSGTQGKTRDEITELLGATGYKEMFDSYSGLSNEYASMNSSYLSLANKIYVASGYDLNDEFLNTARAYNTEVDSVDFQNVENAAHVINQWANKKLRGLIKDPVSKTSLDKDALVALFNVIYFKGHWHVPFQVESTEMKDFHVNKSLTVKKPMMHLSKSLFFHANDQLGAKMIELPYQEPGFRMVVILPNEVDGLPDVLEKVAQKGLLEDVFALSPARSKVNLYLPKFDIKSSLDFTQILPKLGVNGIFSGGASGIVNGRSVAISKIFQEAIVNVDEEGARAGAFTEREEKGLISWKLEVEYDDLVLQDLVLLVRATTFEDGQVRCFVQFDSEPPQDVTLDGPSKFKREFKKVVVSCELSGGSGDNKYQHAQLFRQPVNAKESLLKLVTNVIYKTN